VEEVAHLLPGQGLERALLQTERVVELVEPLLRLAMRAVEPEEGPLEATSWRSASGKGVAPKTGSASASRMSATVRSAEPAASSVTSRPNSWARASITRAESGRWLFSIWLR
jgi:hypothetical protein